MSETAASGLFATKRVKIGDEPLTLPKLLSTGLLPIVIPPATTTTPGSLPLPNISSLLDFDPSKFSSLQLPTLLPPGSLPTAPLDTKHASGEGNQNMSNVNFMLPLPEHFTRSSVGSGATTPGIEVVEKKKPMKFETWKPRRWAATRIDMLTVGGSFPKILWMPEVTAEYELRCEERKARALSSLIVDDIKIPQERYDNDSDFLVPSETLPVLCTFEGCGKRFKDYQSMKKHAHIHKPKDFFCDQCTKSFGSEAHLAKHMKVHSDDRPFKCDVEGCGKSFTMEFNYKSHMKIHSGDLEFSCPFEGCNKKFPRQIHLKLHMVVHNQGSQGSEVSGPDSAV